jgi:hypothetical protein
VLPGTTAERNVHRHGGAVLRGQSAQVQRPIQARCDPIARRCQVSGIRLRSGGLVVRTKSATSCRAHGLARLLKTERAAVHLA